LTPDSTASAALDFTLDVERLYGALIRFSSLPTGAEPSLGGKLLYAGEIAPDGRALLVAANIAGAASLAATADRVAQKQAVREGVVDFLVNSLDEALRILKNEIRKRETAAVCIAAAPQAVEIEMLERGVLPDLLAPRPSLTTTALAGNVPRIEAVRATRDEALVIWKVATSPAQWLPKFDAIAMDCLPTALDFESNAARRWLRLAPRYLGRLAQGVRVLRCELNVAKEFVTRIQKATEREEIDVESEITLIGNGEAEVFHCMPRPAH